MVFFPDTRHKLLSDKPLADLAGLDVVSSWRMRKRDCCIKKNPEFRIMRWTVHAVVALLSTMGGAQPTSPQSFEVASGRPSQHGCGMTSISPRFGYASRHANKARDLFSGSDLSVTVEWYGQSGSGDQGRGGVAFGDGGADRDRRIYAV